ncbi:MAG TPA: sigma-70 family RNA polymerase sigma factor [Terriglobales bacterium]|nr:sigma-70 family RNA polymerase sigma factor [Terriglobales bacterium]
MLDVAEVTASACGGCHNVLVNFEALTNQHKDAVYRHMIRVCGNREDAEDVLIEALLKAYRHLDQLRASAAFRSWLTQIARRVCWQLKQSESLQPLLQLSGMEDEGRQIASTAPPPEAQVAMREMKRLLDQAIANLPAKESEVYRLREIEEMPGDQVARRLQISTAAMKSRLHRARKLLREHLDSALSGASPKKLESVKQ